MLRERERGLIVDDDEKTRSVVLPVEQEKRFRLLQERSRQKYLEIRYLKQPCKHSGSPR